MRKQILILTIFIILIWPNITFAKLEELGGKPPRFSDNRVWESLDSHPLTRPQAAEIAECCVIQKRGFHTGPYLMASVGAIQNDWDINQRDKVQEGDTIEPSLGFIFGWHLLDWIGLELHSHYSTSNTRTIREHIAHIDFGLTYTLIWEPLLGLGKWNILPFLKTNLTLGIASLPGDTDATISDRISIVAIGPSIGAGVHFLWKKYLYFGFEAQENYLHYPNKSQNITIAGAFRGNQKIYNGGFKPQWSLLGVIGVHY